LFKRARFQFGSLRTKKRANGPDAWEFRFYEDTGGKRIRRYITVGRASQYPTAAAARKAVQALLLKINSDAPQRALVGLTLGTLMDRYIQEELPERYSTRVSYLSLLNRHIKPKWGDIPLDRVKAMVAEDWLKQLDLAPKTKAHIRSLMHLLFRCAERWELMETGRNPIALVRVKNCTKRLKRPRVLTVEEFYKLLPFLREPYRTMVITAQCLGLRVSEIVALRWSDFDFERLTLLVERSAVKARVDEVKTEYSRDEVPLHPDLAHILLEWRERAPFRGDTDWVFGSPITGKPYYQEHIQKAHLREAGKKAGLGAEIGWHTFRHSYRSWLDETGAPMKVQQELMRHASIQTTMNVYGQAMLKSKREANSKVVEMALRGAPLPREVAPAIAAR